MSLRIPVALPAMAVLLLCTAADAAAADPGTELTLPEARRLALDHQPMLLASAAKISAVREAAVAAAQLPDPKLRGGLTDLTITGPQTGTLRDESDTQFGIGIEQTLPRGDTLRLRGERGRNETALAESQWQTQRIEVQRDVGLAWIEVWQPQRALVLTQAAEREVALQLDTVQIAYRNGRAPQTDVRAARVALELIRDAVAEREQDIAHARNGLSRWLGEEAYRPLPAELPAWREPPPLPQLLEALRTHPHLNASSRQVDVVRSEVDLARQAYKPEVSVELGYGYRPAFADYVNLQVGIDLPVFTAKRQDRTLAEKHAELDQAEQLREDDYREHAAEARLNYADWSLLAARLARFDNVILPEADARIEAARLAWAAGSGTLAAVLDAHRSALDARLLRLKLETDRAKHAVMLRYINGAGSSTDAGDPE